MEEFLDFHSFCKLIYSLCLTIAGTVTASSGRFRPNLLAIIDIKIEPSTIPTGFNDAIHDACAIVISPVANGDLEEVSKKIAGLGQPFIMPK